MEPIPIPAPSNVISSPIVLPIAISLSLEVKTNSWVVDVVPSTIKFPSILTVPVETPIVAGFISNKFPPLIIFVVIPIDSVALVPTLKVVAVIIPLVLILIVVDTPSAVVAVVAVPVILMP